MFELGQLGMRSQPDEIGFRHMVYKMNSLSVFSEMRYTHTIIPCAKTQFV